MTLTNTLLHLTNFRNPFLRTLVPSVSAAFAIQAAVAIPSILTQSERFYDLSGSLTYLSVTTLSLYLPAIRARAAASIAGKALPEWPKLIDAFGGKGGPDGFNWRQVVLSVAVSIWATRRKHAIPVLMSYPSARSPCSTPYSITHSNPFRNKSAPTFFNASSPTDTTPASTRLKSLPPNSSAPSSPKQPGSPCA